MVAELKEHAVAIGVDTQCPCHQHLVIVIVVHGDRPVFAGIAARARFGDCLAGLGDTRPYVFGEAVGRNQEQAGDIRAVGASGRSNLQHIELLKMAIGPGRPK